MRPEITTKRVLYEAPGVDAVTVRRNVVYAAGDAGDLTMDLYFPPGAASGDRLPAVLFVLGYSDIGGRKLFGCSFKEWESFISWARLVAASGLVGITYSTGENPAADAQAVLRHIRENAADLGVDESRIGLWACSGHVPNALAVLMEDDSPGLRCAALLYGFTLDLEGSSAVADAAATSKFVNPAAGRSVADLSRDRPLFLVRAGRDEAPHLNEAMDRFLAGALAAGLPVTLVHHPTAPHAFDVADDSAASRAVIRQLLAFLQAHLLET